MSWPVSVMLQLAYQSIRIVNLSTAKEFLSLYLVSINSNCQKLLQTFHDLRWPQGTKKGVIGCSFPIQCVKFTCIQMLKRMMFFQNKHISIFPHCVIMERVLNWPDLRSPMPKFRDLYFIHTITHINCRKFQSDRSVGVAMSILTFFWDEATWRDLVTWLWVTWVWNFRKMKRCMHRCAKHGDF